MKEYSWIEENKSQLPWYLEMDLPYDGQKKAWLDLDGLLSLNVIIHLDIWFALTWPKKHAMNGQRDFIRTGSQLTRNWNERITTIGSLCIQPNLTRPVTANRLQNLTGIIASNTWKTSTINFVTNTTEETSCTIHGVVQAGCGSIMNYAQLIVWFHLH